MGGSIKLFEFVQNCNRIFGIYSCQSDPKQHSAKLTRTISLISFAQVMFTTVAFFSLEAKSMFDFGFVFYLLVTITNCLAIYLIFIWESQDTLEFIQKCERFIEKREYFCVYRIKLNSVLISWRKFQIVCLFGSFQQAIVRRLHTMD